MRNLKKQKTKNNIVINPNLVIEFAFLNCMMTQDWYITDACFAAVLLEFYAPSHKDCKELASVFEDLAISYQRDPDVIIAKFVRYILLLFCFLKFLSYILLSLRTSSKCKQWIDFTVTVSTNNNKSIFQQA